MLLIAASVSAEPPIRSASVETPDRLRLWPRVRLYVDRIELTEWWGWRRVWCHLPLDALDRVAAPSSTRLALRTTEQRTDCTPLTLELPQAKQWARTIRAFRACL